VRWNIDARSVIERLSCAEKAMHLGVTLQKYAGKSRLLVTICSLYRALLTPIHARSIRATSIGRTKPLSVRCRSRRFQ